MDDRELKRLHNHLMAAEENTAPKCRVSNGDRLDVDLAEFARQVDTPPKRSRHWGWLVLVLLALAGITAYILLGGELPWN